jgi:hypothetical protein
MAEKPSEVKHPKTKEFLKYIKHIKTGKTADKIK